MARADSKASSKAAKAANRGARTKGGPGAKATRARPRVASKPATSNSAAAKRRVGAKAPVAKAGAPKAAAPRAVAARAPRAASPKPAKKRSGRARPASRTKTREGAVAVAALDDELRIESAKYDSREARPRVFEEERFVFPESYANDRVRLLVKDPEWLFAHWDVSPSSWGALRRELGDRAFALSRLTLKLGDPASGALSVVLLPAGARSWYLRTKPAHRSYRAELGLTLPTGEFRALASSNVVVTPRVGPAASPARHRAVFGKRGSAKNAAAPTAAELALGAADAPSATAAARRAARGSSVTLIDGAAPGTPAQGLPSERGGSSEALVRGGASDLHRR